MFGCARVGAHATPRGEPLGARSPEPGATVLVVDDDPSVCEALRFLLQLEGLTVRTFASAGEMLEASDLEEAACLIVDYHLGKANGIDLLARLRGRGVNAPCILITGNPDAGLQKRAAEVGVLRVIEKPLADDTLLDLVLQQISQA